MTVLENRSAEGTGVPESAKAAEEAADPRDPQVRLAALLDEGSIRLITPVDRSGVLAAMGRMEGVPVVVFCSDARVQGGAMGSEGCEHIVHAYDVAVRERVPVVGVWHSGGARLAEGVESLHAVGRVFAAMTRASGVVPQLSVVVGPAAGGAAYGPALTDIVILAQEGRIFVTGPDVVRSVTGEQIDMAALGGPEPHSKRSGVVHVVAKSETDAYLQARRLAVLLGHQGRVRTEVEEVDFSGLLPENARRAYDVKPLVKGLLDEPGVELHPKWAPNIVTTLGRLGGRTVGVIANNPMRLGGCLDSASAEKAARFVRMCDAFGVPLIVLVDVPGYLPGVGQEHDGVVRRGAKLLHAFAEASVPRVTLVTRKAYGGAYIAMNSRSLGATKVFAWPTTQVAVMGALAAVRILKRREIAAAPEEERSALEARLAEEHEVLAGGLDRAIELGVVDEVIKPEETRGAIARIIAQATPARGAHGNIPL
ncbi:acyl-CoA carboxylase subunit beta [Planomonospora parontospora]|uniref:acyl-CoA carboxylase subunit beta n=1 Tax=Planomonospora parontospora TaxID=58119 RepID=UPI00166FCEE5|nr:carboxyl transferase domain-containing protein [Planomonospora parontospora]GGL18989.1 putative propionyl-CoA carboxylase beta chain 6 [Planomonospora parontospora subsp. antibiotica]GII15491.1 putative propionyl-CoA carboxylase beta chain 6 [Planomonospora parontospora subsp. antibiotica]